MKFSRLFLYQMSLYVLFVFAICLSNADIGYCEEYLAELESSTTNVTILPFEGLKIPIVITNKGSKLLASDSAENPVFVSYHLLGQDGTLIKYDNVRTPLAKPVPTGEEAQAFLKIEDLEPGKYILKVDLVAEGKTWFELQGTRPLNIPLDVKQMSECISTPKFEFESFNNEFRWYVDGEEAINACSMISLYTLRENYCSFLFENVPVSGFTAGVEYPQIWIRDTSTIMPVARYILKDLDFISWIFGHLAVQKEDGEVFDWIKEDQATGKNTAESDQESSLVIAAYEISRAVGYEWLKEDINSQAVLGRLDKALRFVFNQKWDTDTGLIKSGNTADWGDVTNEFNDQRATNVYDKSHQVVGIYTNSMVYGAALKLATMFGRIGQEKESDYWKRKATHLLQNIQKVLWQQDKGFFRVHQHVNFPADDFDESNIFPMGGNAVAIDTGVATHAQAEAIFKNALFRQKLFNVSTVSGTLLPCYPKGYFRHPVLNDYFEYQNGGEWDWFGNRLILQMFRHDHPEAFNKLAEVCKQVYKNRGLFEWNSLNGTGQGSAHFAGSAGTLATASIEGLFGVGWEPGEITIRPRLGKHSGYIYVPQVGRNEFVSYRYEWRPGDTPKAAVVKMTFGSNAKSSKKVMLPRVLDNMHCSRVEINGKEIAVNKLLADSSAIEVGLSDKSEIVLEYTSK